MTGAITKMASAGAAAGGPNILGGLAQSAMANSPILQSLQAIGSGQVNNPFANAMAGAGGQDTLMGGDGSQAVDGYDSLPQLSALPQPELGAAGASNPTDYRSMTVRAAQKWGVDPATALKVGNAEGKFDGWIQSQVGKGSARGQEPSYGPFQMLVGGGDTGFPEGMGNQLIKEKGIDPRDPANAEQVIDFAMEQASKHGWGQWYGAKAAGVGDFDGIKGNPGAKSIEPRMAGHPSGGSALANTPKVGPQADDPYATLFANMFQSPDKPGQGEQQQKSMMEKLASAAGGAVGRGAPQIAGGGEQAQAGPVYDDSADYLAQANQRINIGRSPGKGEERKMKIRQRMGGDRS